MHSAGLIWGSCGWGAACAQHPAGARAGAAEPGAAPALNSICLKQRQSELTPTSVPPGPRRGLSKRISNSRAVKLVTGVRSRRGRHFQGQGWVLCPMWTGIHGNLSRTPIAYVFENMSTMFIKVRLLTYMLYACWAANLCTFENFIPVSSACSIATCNNNPLIKCHPS